MNLKENPFTYFKELDPKENIWAKIDGTSLQRHSIEVAKISQEITKNFYIHEKYNKYKEVIKKLIVLSSYIHDAGKADKRWQKYIKGGSKDYVISHPLFSLPIAKSFLEKNLKNDFENKKAEEFFIDMALLSVATHHSPFTVGKYNEFRGIKPQYFYDVFPDGEPYQIFESAKDELFNAKLNPRDKRYFYVLINGIISLSDWIASIGEKYLSIDKSLKSKYIDYYFSRKKIKPYYYQERAKSLQNDLFVQLPTGAGKTEASLLWFAGLLATKLFYTLPTVTTVDAMRSRFENIFKKDMVSFSHHLLEISLLEEERLTETELFVQKHLIRPIVVTTIDRILLSLMNWKRYTVSEVMLNNAALIIDEIHSYSPFTFSLIIEALQYLKEYYDTKICIMSATLPKMIQDYIINEVYDNLFKKEKVIIKPLLLPLEIKKEYEIRKRTKIEKFYHDEYIEDNISVIIDKINRENLEKILVVTNTVSKSQYIFDELRNFIKNKGLKWGIMLLHSRFNYGDRYDKIKKLEEVEKRTEKGTYPFYKFILVATQIVEVSLDIDFDVLFTEIAPIDAIVQRAGRINRKGRKGKGKIYIFDVKDDNKGYLPYAKEQIKHAREIIERWMGQTETEKDYLDMNEKFYENLKNNFDEELSRKKLDDFLGQIYEKSNIDKILRTRDAFLTMPVVPIKFKDEIEKINDRINKIKDKIKGRKKESKEEILNLSATRAKYFVPLTFYNVKDNLLKTEERRIIFVDLDYDSCYGIKSKGEVTQREVLII